VSRPPSPEAAVDGRSGLSLTNEEREVLAELLSELLLAALAAATPAEASR